MPVLLKKRPYQKSYIDLHKFDFSDMLYDICASHIRFDKKMSFSCKAHFDR